MDSIWYKFNCILAGGQMRIIHSLQYIKHFLEGSWHLSFGVFTDKNKFPANILCHLLTLTLESADLAEKLTKIRDGCDKGSHR